MTIEQLNRELLLCKITLYEKESILKPEYKEFLLKRITLIDQELKWRVAQGKSQMEFKFIGLPSYDLRVIFVISFFKLNKISGKPNF